MKSVGSFCRQCRAVESPPPTLSVSLVRTVQGIQLSAIRFEPTEKMSLLCVKEPIQEENRNPPPASANQVGGQRCSERVVKGHRSAVPGSGSPGSDCGPVWGTVMRLWTSRFWPLPHWPGACPGRKAAAEAVSPC